MPENAATTLPDPISPRYPFIFTIAYHLLYALILSSCLYHRECDCPTFYLLALDVFGIAGYAVAGLYTAERLNLIALMVIPMLLGLGLGSVILKMMSERVFRYAVVVLIVLSSLSVLVREVASL